MYRNYSVDRMEHVALFEDKIAIGPTDMNTISSSNSLESVLLKHLGEKLEGKCSTHGYVIPKTLEILSRSMGFIENGRRTGNTVFHIQAQGKVYNPSNGIQIVGQVLRKNKMGLYIVYNEAIRILVPRDLHIDNADYESLQPGENIKIELRKSRFQINDTFILSIGLYMGRADSGDHSEGEGENDEENENDEGNEEGNEEGNMVEEGNEKGNVVEEGKETE